MSSLVEKITDQIHSVTSRFAVLPKWQKYSIIGGIGMVGVSFTIWSLFEVDKTQKLKRIKYQNDETSVPEYKAKLRVKCDNMLGECPIWDNKRKLLCWIDAYKHKFCTLSPSTNVYKAYNLPERPGSFCLTNDGGFLISFSKGPAFYNPLTNNGRPVDDKERIFLFEQNRRGTDMNDGRVDRNGRFVVGGMVKLAPKISKYVLLNIIYQIYNLFKSFYTLIEGTRTGVYRINIDLNHEKLFDGLLVANSICFSLKGDKMYLTDTVANTLRSKDRIMEYKYGDKVSKNGKIYTKQCMRPDGACVDSEDYVWSAQCGTGKVIRYDKNGKINLIVNVPATDITCCTFGGDNLDTLFITTLKPIVINTFEWNPSKWNGQLYSVKIDGIKGVLENRFLGFSVQLN